MSLVKISANEALQCLEHYDDIIDARSPAEFAEDHLPGAQNWPSLDNDERKEVGTDYKQVGGFEAKKIGAALVARNIAQHIDAHVRDKPVEWRPLIYCWRGGKRSGTLAWFLDQIGFQSTVIDGGYKAFRAAVLEELLELPLRHQFRVICGKTGSGKTRFLQALKSQGAQVLDLEALARHRGSVLGWLPDTVQPTQKRFDTLLWHALKQLDPSRVVWVEAESKKIGNLQVPESLLTQMRVHSPCVNLELSMAERIRLLLDEYSFFVKDPEYFCARVSALRQHCGSQSIDRWQTLARSGDLATAFEELMTQHYDPIYLQSMRRNFRQYSAAPSITLKSSDFDEYLASAAVLSN